MALSVKVNRPNRLSEDETLSSFQDWKNQIEFYLSQDKDFLPFINGSISWKKSSIDAKLRGLPADKVSSLLKFLGVVASLSPPLLHGDIVYESANIASIYEIIREYYQFSSSESTFLKFSSIKREINGSDLERPQHLYLRIRQFVRENLL